ncbi:hypothetical protein BVC80_1835g128 [Macleaya cordata]|uniref:Uncharacterized protein n=1 Tax=Macleaya cordata TaxID=56857 RepID=A0A200R505_MACCD|nr:hypothetical protein BVC80_1835g128 [Macleaya cordata]
MAAGGSSASTAQQMGEKKKNSCWGSEVTGHESKRPFYYYVVCDLWFGDMKYRIGNFQLRGSFPRIEKKHLDCSPPLQDSICL